MTAEFDTAWATASRVPGWLSRDQGRALWDAAATLPPDAVILEIGSHQGRSTVVLGRCALTTGARVVAVDTFVPGRLFGGPTTRDKFERNVHRAGLDGVVRLLVEPSTDVRRRWAARVDLVFVDGKHDLRTVRDDLRWADHLGAGRTLLLHDAFSSIGVTLAVLVHVLPGRSLRYVGRTGSLARFVVGRPSGRDRLRILRELPWFLRNVVVKLALRPMRILGRYRPDPY